MPIDPSIPLGVLSPPAPNPLQALSAVAQLQAVRENAELRREQVEIRRQAAEAARAKARQQEQIDVAWQEAVSIDPVTGQTKVDRAKLKSQLPGHLWPSVDKELDLDETRVLDLQTKRNDLTKSQRALATSMADTIAASNFHPAVIATALKRAHAEQVIDDDQFSQLSQADPETFKTLIEGLRTHTAEKPQLVERVLPTGETVKEWVVPKVGEQYEQAPKDVSLQAKDVLVDGRPAMATFNPHTGQYTVGGQDVTARVRPIPPQGPGPEPIVSIMGPDGKPIYVTRSQALGKTPGSAAEGGGVKLSAAQQEDISTMLTVEGLVNDVGAIDKQAGGLPGVGPVEGRFLPSVRGSGGTTGEALRNKIGNIQGTIAKLRGGTSFTPTEQALLETYTPTTTDTDAAIRTKLATLKDFIQKKRENTLRVAKGEYTLPTEPTPMTPAPTNPFRK